MSGDLAPDKDIVGIRDLREMVANRVRRKFERDSGVDVNIPFKKKDIHMVIDAILGLIRDLVNSGKIVNIASFGKFYYDEREFRNPGAAARGEENFMVLSRMVRFKPSTVWRKQVKEQMKTNESSKR